MLHNKFIARGVKKKKKKKKKKYITKSWMKITGREESIQRDVRPF